MVKIEIETRYKKMLADVYTPVGIYLRLRDRFRDTILLESSDYHSAENSFSFICINAIAGMEITDTRKLECKFPGEKPERIPIQDPSQVPALLWDFMQRFEVPPAIEKPATFAQGLFGYTSFDAVQFFDTIRLKSGVDSGIAQAGIPLMRYRLYQYVIVINHFKDELFLCENRVAGVESDIAVVESLIRSKDVPVYPFHALGEESSNLSDEEYMEMVRKGIKSCHRGDTFQIVLSRRFQQKFRGDEFNVYRSLRNI